MVPTLLQVVVVVATGYHLVSTIGSNVCVACLARWVAAGSFHRSCAVQCVAEQLNQAALYQCC